MNQVVIFDTHQTIKHFIKAGFTELQAEVMVEEQKKLLEKNLATKQDLAEVNFKIEELRKEIELMTNKFTNRMYIAIFSSVVFFVTILKVLQL